MRRRSIFVTGLLLTSILGLGITAAESSWQKGDPSQWTSEDVYQILNNSPWSKSVKVTVAMKGSPYGDENPGNGGNNGTWGEGAPGIGMGRGRGLGGGGLGAGGMGRGRGSGRGYPNTEPPPTVTVQWQSAFPVRLAQAKMSDATGAPDAMKPLNEYVIAVIGLPKSGFAPQTSTSSSGEDADDTRLADHLKTITALSIGHEQLNPKSVELNQGRDARTIFHFEKSEPITLHDKDAEFRIVGNRMEIKKKFVLKDMEY